MMTSRMTASLIATITPLNWLEVFTPKTQQSGQREHDHRGHQVVVVGEDPRRGMGVPRR